MHLNNVKPYLTLINVYGNCLSPTQRYLSLSDLLDILGILNLINY